MIYLEDERSAKPRLTYGETCWQAIVCFSAQERSTRLFLNGGPSSWAETRSCCWRCASDIGRPIPSRIPFATRSKGGGDGGGVSVKSTTSTTVGLEAPEVSTRLMETAGSPEVSGEHLKQASKRIFDYIGAVERDIRLTPSRAHTFKALRFLFKTTDT